MSRQKINGFLSIKHQVRNPVILTAPEGAFRDFRFFFLGDEIDEDRDRFVRDDLGDFDELEISCFECEGA